MKGAAAGLVLALAASCASFAGAEFGCKEGAVDQLREPSQLELDLDESERNLESAKEQVAQLSDQVKRLQSRVGGGTAGGAQPAAGTDSGAAPAGDPSPPGQAGSGAPAPANLVAGLAKVRAARAAILAYYHNDTLLLDKSPRTQPADDHRLIAKIASTLLGRKVPGGKSFNIGVVGSSVSAGHDVFGRTSYPMVLQVRDHCPPPSGHWRSRPSPRTLMPPLRPGRSRCLWRCSGC